MKKIVGSASVAITVTVGVYLVALALGASEPDAFAFAAVAAFAVAGTVAFAVAGTSGAVGTSAAVAAFAVAGTATVAVAFVAVAFVAVVAFASVVAKQEGIRFRWAFAAYVLEVAAVGGALTVGSAGGSVAIVLTSVTALLLVLWRFAPKSNLVEQAAVAAHSEHNGA